MYSTALQVNGLQHHWEGLISDLLPAKFSYALEWQNIYYIPLTLSIFHTFSQITILLSSFHKNNNNRTFSFLLNNLPPSKLFTNPQEIILITREFWLKYQGRRDIFKSLVNVLLFLATILALPRIKEILGNVTQLV